MINPTGISTRTPGTTRSLRLIASKSGPPVEVGGQRQDDGDLGQFRRLEGKGTQGEPAPGAGHHLPPEHDGHQQQDADDIDGVAQLFQVPVIIGQGHEHHAQAHGQPVELLDVEGGPLPPVVAGAVEIDDARGDR